VYVANFPERFSFDDSKIASFCSIADLNLVCCYAAAPNLGSDDSYGVWRIDDTDNSFSTQPFKIRYARQDVPLSVLVAFNLSLSNYEVLNSSMPHEF